MTRIAVVEDDSAYRRQLREYLQRYERESGEALSVTEFSDGLEIAEHYSSSYDIIFMDIQMSHLDGMQTAQRIRAQDKTVIIIFITNLAQFALQGYKVEALDYVLKPIQYFAFSQVLQKAVKKVRDSSAFSCIWCRRAGCCGWTHQKSATWRARATMWSITPTRGSIWNATR